MVSRLKNSSKIRRINRKIKHGKYSSSLVPSIPIKVWEPGVDKLEEGEELQYDPSTYNYMRKFNFGWPCMSFDILHDSLGLVRSEFPHTVYGVFGSQAEQGQVNSLGIFKVSNISGKKRDLVPSATTEEDIDIDSESSSDEEDVCDGPTTPIFQRLKFVHEGCVNRIRAMPQMPHICATWANRGLVQVWDFHSQLNALAESEARSNPKDNYINHITPIFKFYEHKEEGFAIDWSPVVPGRLISGDCNSRIHLWEPSSNSWNVDKNPFVGHQASVEDLQWSPIEADIFASCSVDGNILIWDSRIGKSPAAYIKAHDTDVNVISWNRLASCMIASGSDDGSFSIWDLRLIKGDSRVAHFEYHKRPITSIEWSPHEASALAVSSDDNQLTIWDLSLERDEEEEAEFKAKVEGQANAPLNLPPQLLFLHQGKEIKELHWHQQIPGMILCTDSDAIDIAMPTNICASIPSAA